MPASAVGSGTSVADRRWQRVVAAVIALLRPASAVEGAYLSGSLVGGWDWFSDVDLGVATKDSARALAQAWALRHRITHAAGTPIRTLERGWEHTRLVAMLYGKSEFPPVGLEVDVAFSQLRHVGEQMPYAPWRIVFDRRGRLRPALSHLRRRKPAAETRRELAARLTWFGFFMHDALKAFGRRDLFSFQHLLEDMRGALYHAAGVRAGRPVYEGKWAFRYMSAPERRLVEGSYREFTPQAVRRLARAYLSCVVALASRYGLQREVADLERSLAEIL